MPKYTKDLKLISSEDQDFFGQTFCRYSHLNSSGVEPLTGFVISFSLFEEMVSPLLPKIAEQLIGSNEATPVLVKQIQKIALPNLVINNELKSELSFKVSNLKSPFFIRALTKTSGREEITFEAVVKNLTEVYQTLPSAWLSFLNSKSLNRDSLSDVLVSVCVTTKISAEVSGKAFILGGPEGLIEIESQWGEYNPTAKADVLQIDRKTLAENSYVINPQKQQLIYKGSKLESLKIAEKFQNNRKLPSNQAERIASALKKIQSKALNSVEVDFEISNNRVVFTDINFNIEKGKKTDNLQINIELPIIQTLRPVVPGLSTGFAKLIKNQKDLKKLKVGDIAILDTFKKDYLPSLKKVSGIILRGTKTVQADLLPKLNSLGVATVQGVMEKIPTELITLNGRTGKIHLGALSPLRSMQIEPAVVLNEKKVTKTATKIFLALQRNSNVQVTLDQFDGIGPVNSELFFTRFGLHPKELVQRSEFKQVAKDIEDNLGQLANALKDKPVIYQLSDFKSSELINLKHGERHEIGETNPFLGKRGLDRHLQNLDLLKAEISLVKNLRNKQQLKNIWVSLPFVRTETELTQIKKIFSSQGLYRSPSFKLLITLATPANLFQLDSLIESGIDGCLIDYYNLANLVYGKDFTYAEIAALDDPAIERVLENIVKTLAKAKLFSGIFNLPLDSNKKLLKNLVDLGIKSISVNESFAVEARNLIADIEKQIVLKK